MDQTIKQLNGTKGDSSSFVGLERLLSQQAYYLCYWKAATDEINYRRFFDINDLMAIRMEDRQVFDDSHRLVFQWLKEGRIQGLRIDHPDGLYNPTQYFNELQSTVQGMLSSKKLYYILLEKILEHGEELVKEWPVSGTTGYEYMNQLNDVFVDTTNEKVTTQLMISESM